MKERGQSKRRNVNLNFQELDAFRAQLEILKQIIKILSSLKEDKYFENLSNEVNLLVTAIPNTWLISKQNLSDIQLELRRLDYMVMIFFFNFVHSF